MLFNSFAFIFGFLPAVLVGYHVLNRHVSAATGAWWLIVMSLFFYAYWKAEYVVLLLASVLVNYGLGRSLERLGDTHRKLVLIGGIGFNIALLAFFKYIDFFIENINFAFSTSWSMLHVALPLAISFFTFQQIAYLVDVYRNEVTEHSFRNYVLFVTFFPQLIAGPIVHHKEMMPQFASHVRRVVNFENLSRGIFIFFIGLTKKVVFADSFGVVADLGFSQVGALSTGEAWLVALSYSFQLYYDFSGYTDMAIGIALMFNITLPINFNSPYHAITIQDFWRRWHITLSRFLKEYVYIPLGGNRRGSPRTYANLLVTFIIGGFWHGAAWTFIIWGLLHGVALMLQRLWQRLSWFSLPKMCALTITFLFVVVTWVFFRAHSVGDALTLLGAMTGKGDLAGIGIFTYVEILYLPALLIGSLLILSPRNSNWWGHAFKITKRYLLATLMLAFLSLVYLNSSLSSKFLYFDF